MTNRPAIGQRVRLLGNTGFRGIGGQGGTVETHHADGVAMLVLLDGGTRIWCDPINVSDAKAVTVAASGRAEGGNG